MEIQSNNSFPSKLRIIQRLEIPPLYKDSKSLTFLIFPTHLQEEKQKNYKKIVIFEDEIPNISKKRPLKTRKILINSFNSISLSNSSDYISQEPFDSPIKTPLNSVIMEKVVSSEKSTMIKKKSCNCKKSRCLKLYCDCFVNQEFCTTDCSCVDCSNIEKFDEKRQQFIEQVKEKNPTAFTPKIERRISGNSKEKSFTNNENSILIKHNKGCNCRKSGCLKKYCECFQAGVKCTDLCRCDDCKNSNKTMLFYKKQTNIKSFMEPFNNNDDRSSIWEKSRAGFFEGEPNPISSNGLTTTKHQLNSFNSFHSVMKDDKDDIGTGLLKRRKEIKDDEEWGWVKKIRKGI